MEQTGCDCSQREQFTLDTFLCEPVGIPPISVTQPSLPWIRTTRSDAPSVNPACSLFVFATNDWESSAEAAHPLINGSELIAISPEVSHCYQGSKEDVHHGEEAASVHKVLLQHLGPSVAIRVTCPCYVPRAIQPWKICAEHTFQNCKKGETDFQPVMPHVARHTCALPRVATGGPYCVHLGSRPSSRVTCGPSAQCREGLHYPTGSVSHDNEQQKLKQQVCSGWFLQHQLQQQWFWVRKPGWGPGVFRSLRANVHFPVCLRHRWGNAFNQFSISKLGIYVHGKVIPSQSHHRFALKPVSCCVREALLSYANQRASGKLSCAFQL